MDDALITRIFNATTGVWTLVAVVISSTLIAWVRSRPGLLEQDNERRRDVATEKANDFERLRKEVQRLSERVEALENKVEECERERDEYRARAVTAESELIRVNAFHLGVGEGKNTVQTLLSAERNQDESKRK